jgi:L-prolyl-[peptidyl-carrier protein] dehydrogenase
LDFELSDVQAKRYDEVLHGTRARLGSVNGFSRAHWREAARLGLPGLCIPVTYGGSGLNALDTAISLEALGRGCPDTGFVFAICAHLLACAVPVRDFGSEELRRRWLPGIAAELIAANAITEDEAGSDTGHLSVTARRVTAKRITAREVTAKRVTAGSDAGHYVLNGEKSFASNAPVSDVLITYAMTSPGDGFLGLSAFLVPANTDGVTIGTPLAKMGLEGCLASRVTFTDCRVDADLRLGEEGQGSAIFARAMTWERACLFAAYVGLMDEQLDRCVAYARNRRQFGRAIGRFQAVSHRIARMRLRLESARLMLYRACWLIDTGRPAQAASALAKVAVSEAAVGNSLDAMQVFGGAGYLVSCGIERNLRDCVPSRVFSGTNDIQLELIAREAGL